MISKANNTGEKKEQSLERTEVERFIYVARSIFVPYTTFGICLVDAQTMHHVTQVLEAEAE